MATVTGPVGFADTISTWIRSPLDRRGGPERFSRLADLSHAVREPGVRQPEVHESGTCGLGSLRQPVGDDALRELVRDLARRSLLQTRELEGDVRRVVAVLGVAGPLERDGRACELRERVGEPCDGIRDRRARHAPIVGGADYRLLAEGAAVIGTTTPSRWSASCTSSRAL